METTWIDSAFRNTSTLLRHVISGFVVLAVAWAIDKDHKVIAELYASSAQSWWPLLLLALVFGICIYSVHLVFYWPTYGFATYYLALSYLKGKWHGWTDAWKGLLEDDVLRWKRRLSKNPDELAIQNLLDSWSANVHFRYCTAIALIATPIVMDQFGRDVQMAKPIFVGVILFVLNSLDNWRLAKRGILAASPG